MSLEQSRLLAEARLIRTVVQWQHGVLRGATKAKSLLPTLCHGTGPEGQERYWQTIYSA